MSNKNYKAMAYELVTHHPAIKEGEDPWDVLPAYEERETRYRIEDVNTGEVLDDAQGYGYKTARKAYVGYSYKTGGKKKKRNNTSRSGAIKKWFDKHPDFSYDLLDIYFRAAKERMRGATVEETTVTPEVLKTLLSEWNLEVDFPLDDMLKVFEKM